MTTTTVKRAPPLGRLPWLVVAALLAHIMEEWSQFPEWATRHFGTTTPEYYLISHVPIVALVTWSAARAARSTASGRDAWLLAVILIALAANTLFHVGSAVAFAEYSPGVITGMTLYLPLTAFLLPRIAVMIGRRATITATVAGVALSALITASLALEINWP